VEWRLPGIACRLLFGVDARAAGRSGRSRLCMRFISNPLFNGQASARSTHCIPLSSDPAKAAGVIELIAVMRRTRRPLCHELTDRRVAYPPFRSRVRTPVLMRASRTVEACRPKWIPMARSD
jgi:hypothetical protein